ncbi:hypothetical protein UCD39_09530 [Nitrospirillum sp. BR 11752]|uniref:hypothetical protein n=1 Tax=Nitrospirillum sp. BR 11752 TaxID=3104293 RepID=UPI002E9AF7E0|nr:hypothetical protein [Nitrospirillum sp. BR 11752]
MKSTILLAFLACLLASESHASIDIDRIPMESTQGVSEMFGTWTVTKVLCDDCKGRTPEEVGKNLTILPTSFFDPFSITCSADASYPNRQIPSKEVPKAFRLPANTKNIVPKIGNTIDSRLSCKDEDYARILFIGNGKAIYIFEGLDYLLEKKSSP